MADSKCLESVDEAIRLIQSKLCGKPCEDLRRALGECCKRFDQDYPVALRWFAARGITPMSADPSAANLLAELLDAKRCIGLFLRDGRPLQPALTHLVNVCRLLGRDVSVDPSGKA